MTRHCAYCDMPIARGTERRVYCSLTCKKRFHKWGGKLSDLGVKPGEGNAVVAACAICGSEFSTVLVTAKTCGSECRKIMGFNKAGGKEAYLAARRNPAARKLKDHTGDDHLRGRYTQKGILAGMQSSAVDRRLEWAVSVDYLDDLLDAQQCRCALTGVSLSQGSGLFKNNVKIPGAGGKSNRYIGRTMSLDRIDSSKGYVEGNVQWVHKDINIAKACLSNDQFVSMCLNVIVHMTKGLVNV